MANEGADSAASAGPGKVRHLVGFVVSGSVAYSVDAAVLAATVRLFGLDPRLARVAGICLAMVVAWLCHRRLTFAVASPPTLAEFGRYAAAAWGAAGVNYGLFVAILSARPSVHPQISLLIATAFATLFAYIAMRYAVFRTAGRGPAQTPGGG